MWLSITASRTSWLARWWHLLPLTSQPGEALYCQPHCIAKHQLSKDSVASAGPDQVQGTLFCLIVLFAADCMHGPGRQLLLDRLAGEVLNLLWVFVP